MYTYYLLESMDIPIQHAPKLHTNSNDKLFLSLSFLDCQFTCLFHTIWTDSINGPSKTPQKYHSFIRARIERKWKTFPFGSFFLFGVNHFHSFVVFAIYDFSFLYSFLFFHILFLFFTLFFLCMALLQPHILLHHIK